MLECGLGTRTDGAACVCEAWPARLGEGPVEGVELARKPRRARPPHAFDSHAQNATPVLGFWGEITMPSAGIMAYRRDLPSTTKI